MGRFSAFLHASQCASVPYMFPFTRTFETPPAESHTQRCFPESEGDAPQRDVTLKSLTLNDKKRSLQISQPRLLRQHLLVPLAALLLAACGFNGTDPDESENAAERPTAAAPADPDLAQLEVVDIPDSEPRPRMQVQVVLDRQGFGPGVIDGKEGISTTNALKGFQEANDLSVTGRLDAETRQALARWRDVPATRVVRIPESWGQIDYQDVPEEPEDQATLERLGYESLDEKLAERFHTTVEVLQELNPGGRPAGAANDAETASTEGTEKLAAGGVATAQGNAAAARRDARSANTESEGETGAEPIFRPGQLVRVPNVGFDVEIAATGDDEQGWRRTLASLGIGSEQPQAARVVVDKSEGWLKAYDNSDKVVAMFTVTSGSEHDPLPLGEWKILGVSKNPPFNYNPDLFWDADPGDEKARLPPGPNGPVGVVWIDLSKEHYGIHGTPEPQTIGRAQSHGCVRLTNWDAARLAGMVSTSTKVVFQA